jgi:hypothetical protein
MADQNLTELTALTTVASGDLLHIMDDPAGTPVDKKITADNLLTSVAILTAITTLATADEFLVIDDPSGTPVARKVTIANILKAVSALADITTVAQEDLALIIDDPSGTPAAKYVTRRELMGRRYVEVEIFSMRDSETCSTGDGKGWFHVPSELNGMDLIEVHAEVRTAGTTGTMSIQVHNATDAVDMLSTNLTLDSTETGSDTAAAPAVIDTTKDDVATNDMLRIDVDGVHTTPAAGCLVTLGFE